MTLKEKESLNKLREKIDKIDDDIIDLLKERLDIVRSVGKLKKSEGQKLSFIRSGREAEMLRNLTKKIEGDFPKAAIATIWRMIISTSLYTEQEFKVLAYANDEDNSCYWLAREYYGDFVDITCNPSADDIINMVGEDSTSVGILPLIDESESPWWIRPQEEKNDIYVFARIPFIEKVKSFSSPALAIANVKPEPTSEDISVITIKTDEPVEVIDRIFRKIELTPKVLAGDNGNYLIEVAEFVSSDNSKIDELREHFADDDVIRLLGSYAAPIRTY